ncbi:MAG: sulfurtransferase complex subunit TusD [Buchnera aphidicola (Melaphis rhois)]
MYYTLLVTGPPYGTQNASTALLFSRAIIITKNKLLSIFFHCDGVLNAKKLVSFPSREYNLVEKWIDLYHVCSVKLNVCISAASRRGIINNTNNDNEVLKKHDSINSFFCFTGLSELAKYIEKSDRIIQF